MSPPRPVRGFAGVLLHGAPVRFPFSRAGSPVRRNGAPIRWWEAAVGQAARVVGAQGPAARVTATRQTSGPFSRYSNANASSPRVASSV